MAKEQTLSKGFIVRTASRTCGDRQLCGHRAHSCSESSMDECVGEGKSQLEKAGSGRGVGGGLWTQAGLRPEHSLAGLVWKVVASALSHLSPEI